MKRITVMISLFLLCTITLGCMSACYGSYGTVTQFRYDDSESYSVGGGQAAQADTIEIHWISGEVIICPDDVNEITFEEESDKAIDDEMTMRHLLRDGKLIIQYAKSGMIHTKVPSKKLTVRVPRDMPLDELICDTVSASLTIESITCRETAMESVSGDLKMNGCTCRKIDAETVSGNIRLNNTTAMNLEIETVSGNTVLSLPGISGFQCRFSTVSGNFGSTLDFTVDHNTYLYGDGSMLIDVDSVSGSVTVRE